MLFLNTILHILRNVKKKYWHCRQSTYCIWFCSDSFHCWVSPGVGLFHQQFLKTILAFGNMWQLRIWILDLDVFRATNELFFNIHFSAWMHGEKFQSHKGNLKRFSYMWQPPRFLFPVRFCYPKKIHCKEEELGELSPCSKLSKEWEFLDFESGPSPSSDWQSFCSWAMCGFVRACPKYLS